MTNPLERGAGGARPSLHLIRVLACLDGQQRVAGGPPSDLEPLCLPGLDGVAEVEADQDTGVRVLGGRLREGRDVAPDLAADAGRWTRGWLAQVA